MFDNITKKWMSPLGKELLKNMEDLPAAWECDDTAFRSKREELTVNINHSGNSVYLSAYIYTPTEFLLDKPMYLLNVEDIKLNIWDRKHIWGHIKPLYKNYLLTKKRDKLQRMINTIKGTGK